jgi:predicted dehydrogenase
MAPIRIGIIGLSPNSFSSWGATAHLPYLLSSRGQASYEIVALLNSFVEAAASARAHFQLPDSVKAYGSPEQLAADSDIDLVVCVTFVGHHFETLGPSLAAGKRVFVEWPLVTNLDEITKLQKLVASSKILEESVLGLQGRMSPAIKKLREMLGGGTIGKVLSSDVNAAVKLLPVPDGTLPEPAAYMADKTKGANMVTVGYGHMIDYIHAVLGEWEKNERHDASSEARYCFT